MATQSLTLGLHALLQNSLDYAGMFPPAGLPLEAAFREYARHRSSPAAWLLSRFVCPANRLAELASLAAREAPLSVSALALPCQSRNEWNSKLHETLDHIKLLLTTRERPVQVDSIEFRLPADLAGQSSRPEVQELITATFESLQAAQIVNMTPFFEVGNEDWEAVAGATIEAIAVANAPARGRPVRRAAFKLRTGGLTAAAFPTINQIAFVMTTCQDWAVRFKCTAGLHHLIRRYHESVGTKMHGFLNVFAAAVLAHRGTATAPELRSVLADEDPAGFRFYDDGLRWRNFQATIEEILAARRDLLLSFGSCSFEEPVADLRDLGLL